MRASGFNLILSLIYPTTLSFLATHPPFRHRWILKSSKNPFDVLPDIPLSKDISELPDSFEDSVVRASKRTLAFGQRRCRIDFDTTVGDMTYTSLKNTMPMVKDFTKFLSKGLGLCSDYFEFQLKVNTNDTEAESSVLQPYDTSAGTIRIFFPDMGAAALPRRDWKMNTNQTEVPPCVQTASIINDPILKTDKLVILLCPQPSEVDSVFRVLSLADEMNIPSVIINPSLINMDQGFGVRARNIRQKIFDTLETTYKLKTTANGAVVREWPRGFSVWIEDASEADGYRHLSSFKTDPPADVINDLYDTALLPPEEQEKKRNNPAANIAKGMFDFIQGLSKL